ncbi:glycosyltransferase family 2 protein [Hymenobacter sp. CRA2]|uniref:glycosyltransferase family 2 protein n=1 Tax=Hymenobacter sp. CRA2 TaxID=1955620 RepID=UPI00098FFEC7|nr:glycosyltransferase [Hymenobacter sp. CRA2]OON66056.1 hypothetical protein B0919_22760 [Hymenobacter sp. CRA2]
MILLSIVTWNSADSIEACLASILAQTVSDFSVWVVDNASRDDTCARVQRVADRDARVQLHRLNQNTGFCGGHNYVLDRAPTTDYVLLVNPDVDMAPDYLARALQAMQRDPRIGVVCGVLTQSQEADPIIDSAGMEARPDGRYGLRLHGQRLSQADVQAGYVAGADGALPLLRRRFIDDLRVDGQFFDERFFAHKEDWDVAWRGHLYGWRTYLEPACRALHPRVFRPGDLALRRRLAGAIKTDAVKNQLMLLLKNGPTRGGEGFRFWLGVLPRQLAVFLYILLLERASLPAYSYVWRHRRAVLASRRQVQARAALGWAAVPPEASTVLTPLLSICVPCYHRPELLTRALRSIGPLPPDVELVVSDNSTANDHCEVAARRTLAGQASHLWRYYRNAPGGTAASNWAACLQRARGRYVLMLHDDDFLLPGGLAGIMQQLRALSGRYQAVLFGVQVVDAEGRVLRTQTVDHAGYLEPEAAVEQILTNSSLIRLPGMVVTREAYEAVGGPDPAQHDTDDTDLWMRVTARYGLYRVPACTAAYTVHDGALTTGMFDARNLELLGRMFGKARTAQLLPEPRLRRAETQFYHQFILAGTYRALRRGDGPAARQVLNLLAHPQLQPLPVSWRWLPVRLSFQALTHLDARLSRKLLPATW